MREGIAGWWQLKEYFFTAERFSVFCKLLKKYLSKSHVQATTFLQISADVTAWKPYEGETGWQVKKEKAHTFITLLSCCILPVF